MSQSTQEDGAAILSIIQPGAPLYPVPDPLPGELILQSKRRVGAYSDVYEGIWAHEGKEEVVCIKCVRNTVPGGVDPGCPDLTPAVRFERRLRREVGIWTLLKHENVLAFLGYQIKDGQPRLVSPWMRNGSLDMYLRANPDISETEKLELLYQAARGLDYLHNLTPPIAHGNPKLEDILVSDNITAVLCDMGVSRLLLDVHTGLTTLGSVAFQAKELILGESLPTPKSDIYAMGGVILETMSGKKPLYKARTHGMVLLAITTDRMCAPEDHPDLPVDDPLWPLLRRCWSPNPVDRPTATDILEELAKAIARRQPPDDSVIQPGAHPYILPDPLPGSLATGKEIGSGGYGNVYQGVWTQPSKVPIQVAIKCITEARLKEDDPQAKQERFERRIKREVVIWKTTDHKNILPFHGYQISNGKPMLVSPWCKNGSLESYVTKHPNLTDVAKLKLVHDAACGQAYLHSLQPPIIHGDIKPQNVIITDDVVGTLCDFGISRVMTSLNEHTGLTTQGAGTTGYQAKELHEEESSGPTTMSDVYAFGGLILATMSGKAPFYQKKTLGAIILAVFKDETPSPTDHPELPKKDPLWALLRSSWDPIPGKRPSMAQIIQELESERLRRSSSGGST